MAVSVPRYTVDDLDRFPHDGNRYELLDGVLLVTPAPRMVHQIVATRLSTTISLALQPRRLAHVVAPGAVTRLPNTQLEPDVLVIPSRFPSTATWAEIGEHWLAVEVLSRSSRVYDRDFKRDAYLALGVAEVWLVDIDDRSIEVTRTPGERELVREAIAWRPPGTGLVVRIGLDELFEGIE